MNSVHEPGTRTMSKNRLRNNTGSNRAKNKLSAPSAQPIGPAARPGRAPYSALCLSARTRAAERPASRAPMPPELPPAACDPAACLPCLYRLRRSCRAPAACCALATPLPPAARIPRPSACLRALPSVRLLMLNGQ